MGPKGTDGAQAPRRPYSTISGKQMLELEQRAQRVMPTDPDEVQRFREVHEKTYRNRHDN
jgi:hypothetical protein